MYVALRKCKNDCKILKIIQVPDFCPLNPEIARFSIGFCLNLYALVLEMSYLCAYFSVAEVHVLCFFQKSNDYGVY